MSAAEIESDPHILNAARLIVASFRAGALGADHVPEDDEPDYECPKDRWACLALTTSVNYRRNSSPLWNNARAAYRDESTCWIFDVGQVRKRPLGDLSGALVATGVAIQPTKQVEAWSRIANAVATRWGSFSDLVFGSGTFLGLQQTVRVDHKADFPYLWGPKLFNYWCYTLERKSMTAFPDRDQIDLAVDSHVMRASCEAGPPAALDKRPSTERSPPSGVEF